METAQFYYNNIRFDYKELNIHLSSLGIELKNNLQEKIHYQSCKEIDNLVDELKELKMKLKDMDRAQAIIAKSLISRIILNNGNVKLLIKKCEF